MLVTIHRSLFNQIHKNFVTWTTNFFELFPEIYIERNLCQEAGWVYFLLFTYVFSFRKKSDFGLNQLILDFRDKRAEDWEARVGFLVVSECGLGFSYFLLLLRCCLPADLAATTFSNSLYLLYSLSWGNCSYMRRIPRNRIRPFLPWERDMMDPRWTVRNRAYIYFRQNNCCSTLTFSQIVFMK